MAVSDQQLELARKRAERSGSYIDLKRYMSLVDLKLIEVDQKQKESQQELIDVGVYSKEVTLDYTMQNDEKDLIAIPGGGGDELTLNKEISQDFTFRLTNQTGSDMIISTTLPYSISDTNGNLYQSVVLNDSDIARITRTGTTFESNLVIGAQP